LNRQLRLFLDYEFKDFMRILLIIFAIAMVLIFMSANETLDTSESKIAVALLMLWGFSFVGWVDTGIVVNSTSGFINNIGQFSNQYGIVIVSTAIGIFFMFNRRIIFT